MKRFICILFIVILFSCTNKKIETITNRIDSVGDKIFVTYRNSVILIKDDKRYKKNFYIKDYLIHNDNLFLINEGNIFGVEIKDDQININKIYDASDICIYKEKTFLLKRNRISIINKDGYKENILLTKKYDSFKVIEDIFIFRADNNLYLKRLENHRFKEIFKIEYVKFFESFDYSIIYIDFENNIRKYDITTNKDELVDTVPFLILNFKICDNILLLYGENVLELFYLDSKKIEIGKVELLDASLSIKDNSIFILTHNKISILDLTDKKIKKEITLIEQM